MSSGSFDSATDATAMDAAARAALEGGDLARAEARLRDAIAQFGPRPDRLAMLGQTLLRLGRPHDAVNALRTASAGLAEPAAILLPLGIALFQSGDPRAAVMPLEQATARAPENPDAWNALGLAHSALGDTGRAEAAYRRALAVLPRHTPALGNLCDLLVRVNRLDEALDIAERATALHPDDAGAWFKLGHLRMLVPALDAARGAFQRSAALQPGYAPTYLNLGLIDEWSGRLEEAEIEFRTALSLAEHNGDARFGLATTLLKQRRADEGWKLYAQGAAGVAQEAVRRIRARVWDGMPIAEGALLIDADQGLGDVLQYVRFVPLARALVPRVMVFCDDYRAPLKPLLASMGAIDAVVDRRSGAHAVGATCLLSELPDLLQLGGSAFDPVDAYLAPPEPALRRWAARVAELPGRKVGICWGGNPRPDYADAHRIDRRRSIPARRLALLQDVPGMTLLSLQKGPASGDSGAFTSAFVDWTTDFTDFAETAALIANLDLVISVDTSIVHCAGSIGAPVWMLDRFDNCWRWGTDPNHPGWYRQLRIFRQPSFGDWDGVIDELHRALGDWVRAGTKFAPHNVTC